MNDETKTTYKNKQLTLGVILAAKGLSLRDDPQLRWFEFEHLPPLLAAMSVHFARCAANVVASVQRGPQRDLALVNLLAAKDAAVRAVVEGGGVGG